MVRKSQDGEDGSLATVLKVVKGVKQKREANRLMRLWREKTGTDTPEDWSRANRTPILLCVPAGEREAARQAFGIINRRCKYTSDEQIQAALAFLEGAAFYGCLGSGSRDEAFRRGLLRKFADLMDLDEMRGKLMRTGVQPYDWTLSQPAVKRLIDEECNTAYKIKKKATLRKSVEQLSESTAKRFLLEVVDTEPELALRIAEKLHLGGLS